MQLAEVGSWCTSLKKKKKKSTIPKTFLNCSVLKWYSLHTHTKADVAAGLTTSWSFECFLPHLYIYTMVIVRYCIASSLVLQPSLSCYRSRKKNQTPLKFNTISNILKYLIVCLLLTTKNNSTKLYVCLIESDIILLKHQVLTRTEQSIWM